MSCQKQLTGKQQLTCASVLTLANVVLVYDVVEGRPAGARVVLSAGGELRDVAHHALVHTPLPVLVVLTLALPGGVHE